MMHTTFVYSTYIATTPEKLWEALTMGDVTEKYFFGRRIQSDWQVGSELIFLRENDELDVTGRIVACDPTHLLAYTWTVPGDSTERKEPTRVTFELKHLNSTVKLTLTHENLQPTDFVEESDTFAGLNNGWPAILSNLKSLLETGKTLSAIVV